MSITLAYYTVAWFYSLIFIINHIVVSRFPESQLLSTVCLESAEASLHKKVDQWDMGGFRDNLLKWCVGRVRAREPMKGAPHSNS